MVVVVVVMEVVAHGGLTSPMGELFIPWGNYSSHVGIISPMGESHLLWRHYISHGGASIHPLINQSID